MTSRAPHRRALLAGLATFGGQSALRAAPAGPAPRLVALEWSLASTLLSIGLPPVGIGEPDGYRAWVREPDLPPGIADVGVRNEPNLEALAALRPDRILISPLSASIRPLLDRIAPVDEFAIFTADRDPLHRLRRLVRTLGARYDREREAAAVVADTDRAIADRKAALAGRTIRPLLAVNFVDPRHVRVYGTASLFGQVLAELGLRNGWDKPGNLWGFDLVGIEELATVADATIVVVAPLPPDVRLPMPSSGLWSHLAPVRAGRTSVLPAVWPFGDLVAARRFAELLAAGLDREAARLAG